ncbi:hypothetical protein TNCV_920931, partial [Trichonephila clavipes]
DSDTNAVLGLNDPISKAAEKTRMLPALTLMGRAAPLRPGLATLEDALQTGAPSLVKSTTNIGTKNVETSFFDEFQGSVYSIKMITSVFAGVVMKAYAGSVHSSRRHTGPSTGSILCDTPYETLLFSRIMQELMLPVLISIASDVYTPQVFLYIRSDSKYNDTIFVVFRLRYLLDLLEQYLVKGFVHITSRYQSFERICSIGLKEAVLTNRRIDQYMSQRNVTIT